MKSKIKLIIIAVLLLLVYRGKVFAQNTLTLDATYYKLIIGPENYRWNATSATPITATGPYVITGSGTILYLGYPTVMSYADITSKDLTLASSRTSSYAFYVYNCDTLDLKLVGKTSVTDPDGGIGIKTSKTTKTKIVISGDSLYVACDSVKTSYNSAFIEVGIGMLLNSSGFSSMVSNSHVVQINSGYIVSAARTGIGNCDSVIINGGVISALGSKIITGYGIYANHIIINGGSVKSTGNNVAAVNSAGDTVYCVTLPHNSALSIGMNNGTKDTTLTFQAHHEGDDNFYLYLPNGTYTFTCGDKHYMATVDGSDVVAGDITIESIAGLQTYDVLSFGFANADILKLVCTDKSDSTAAVVVDGKIEFYTPTAAKYIVTKQSTVTASLKSSIYPGTKYVGIGGCNLTDYYKGKPEYYGCADEPITALTHFVGVDSAATGDVSSSWKAMNTFLGYDQYGTTTVSGGPCWILAEDRDETTGKLLASFYFDPSIGEPGSDALKGPHAFNVIFNPTDATISTALASHSEYSGSTTRQAEALDSVIAVRDAQNSMILANVGFMRAFITKAKTYTFDIATLSEGKFKTGDILQLKYLLGSNNANYYHSGTSAATKALEAFAQVQTDIDTVDENGYVKFYMYGGGFFTLEKLQYPVIYSAKNGTISVTCSDTIVASGARVLNGSGISITATPDAGYKLDSILVNGIKLDGTSYIVSDTTEITAVFSLIPFSVVYSAINGTISVTCSDTVVSSGASLLPGSVITITTTPASGFKLDSVIVNGSVLGGNDYTITGATEITAVFSPNQFPVTFSSINGTITVITSDTAIISGASILTGSIISITATPATGYKLDSVLVNGLALSGNSYTVTDTTNITAVFSIQQYVVSYITENGSLMVTANGTEISSGESVDYGTELSLLASAYDGYQFDSLVINGVASTISETTFTVTADVSLAAYFSKLSGINTEALENIWVYTTDRTIYVHEAANANIYVYSVTGQLLTIQQSGSNTLAIPVPQSGMYIINVVSANGSAEQLKCIVE